MMTNELSTGKTIFILAVVVGCFAILWPKVFYPMLTASVKTSTQPAPQWRDPLNAFHLTQLCFLLEEQRDPLSGYHRWTEEECFAQLKSSCRVVLTERILEGFRLEKDKTNLTECLRQRFALTPQKVSAAAPPPTRTRPYQPNAVIHPHVRPERPSSLHSDALHPALREKGRVMPQRTIEKEARPGPMPGLRPPMGGGGHMVPPQSKGSGAMGIIMPLYTVGIVIFFIYTIMKVLFKKNCEEDKTPKLKDFHMDPEYRKYVFAEEYLDSANASHRDLLRRQEREVSRQRRRQEVTPPDTKIGKPECEQISSAISLILADLDMVSKEVDARKDALKEELEEARKREEAAKDNNSIIEEVEKIDKVEELKFSAKSQDFTKLDEFSSFEDTLSHISKFHRPNLPLKKEVLISNGTIPTTTVTPISSISSAKEQKLSNIKQLFNFDCNEQIKNDKTGLSPEILAKWPDCKIRKYSDRCNASKSDNRIDELNYGNFNPLFNNKQTDLKTSNDNESYKCSCNIYSPNNAKYETHNGVVREVTVMRNMRMSRKMPESPANIHEGLVCSCVKQGNMHSPISASHELERKIISSKDGDNKIKTQNQNEKNTLKASGVDTQHINTVNIIDTNMENLKNLIGSRCSRVVEDLDDQPVDFSSEKFNGTEIFNSEIINLNDAQDVEIKMQISDAIQPNCNETTFDISLSNANLSGVNLTNVSTMNNQTFLGFASTEAITEEFALPKSKSDETEFPHFSNDTVVKALSPKKVLSNIINDNSGNLVNEIKEHDYNIQRHDLDEMSESAKPNSSEFKIIQFLKEGEKIELCAAKSGAQIRFLKEESLANTNYSTGREQMINCPQNGFKRDKIAQGNNEYLHPSAAPLQNLSNSIFEPNDQDKQTKTSRRRNKNAARKARRQKRFKTYDNSFNNDAMGLEDVTNATTSKDGAASSSSPPDPNFVIPQSTTTPKAEEAVLLANKGIRSLLKESPAQTADDDESVETKVEGTSSTVDISKHQNKTESLNQITPEEELSGNDIIKYGYEVLKNVSTEIDSEISNEKALDNKLEDWPIEERMNGQICRSEFGKAGSSVEELTHYTEGSPLLPSTGD